MITTSEILETLGQKRVGRALGVVPPSISNAKRVNRFPACWFLVLREMCGEAGLDCPEALFHFKARRP